MFLLCCAWSNNSQSPSHSRALPPSRENGCPSEVPSVFHDHDTIAQPGFLNCQSLECNLDDFEALNAFHKQLDDPINAWDGPIAGCCHRTGVICENSTTLFPSKVIGLDLGSRKLRGFMADSLPNLDQLRFLNLSNNLLRGSLPVKLFQMQNLQVLDLSHNYLYGSFHANISLPSMKSLNISNNKFDGPVEASLCHNSSNIEALDLSNNYFSGEVPSSIANCSSLQQLILNANGLSGTLPEAIFELHNLKELQLQRNGFSGQLDARIGKLAYLVKLDISDNRLSGAIPDIFMRLAKLDHFAAGSNNFSGPPPYSLVNSPSISSLYLGNNSLTGPISINCSAMIRITHLDLHSNAFDGWIPAEISACHHLTYLSLGRNQMMLPSELPSGFRSLKALRHLLLTEGSLVNFHAALQTLQHSGNLTTLIMNQNFMDEEIPQDPDLQFPMLKTLVIANSQLRGSLPLWLRGCTKLQVLDLSWNRLSGTIPAWIGGLSHLFYLDLSLNSLTGGIQESLAEIVILRSHGNSSIIDSSSVVSIYYQTPGGRSLKYNDIWSLPPTLDLSSNMLTGPIISGLGNLGQLHMLRLQNNCLSGVIPDTLSGMENLEHMDLSHNNLSGKIPSSLIRLNFLSYFNVSFNRLEGAIPSGGQFITFPASSFMENKDLRGPLDWNHYQGSLPAEEEEMSFMDQFMLPFVVGAAVGMVLTVGFCFVSGWVFR